MPLTAQSNEIEALVIDDFVALLVAGGLTALAGMQVEDDQPTYPRVTVDIEAVEDGIQDGQGAATGVYRVTLLLTCQTQAGDATAGDDATGAALKTLMGAVRDLVIVDDLVAQLNTLAHAEYYAVISGGASNSTEGRLRYGQFRFTVIMQPGIIS
jgi:hypothetical protein